MKRKFLFSAGFIALLAVASRAQGVITFAEANHDFGAVTEGAPATHEFTFTNTGNAPVVISSVQASCGCTTPFWTKEPILPGKKGKVTASYNSSGRPGAFNKSVTVTSNANPSTHVLTIKGIVNPKTEATATPEQLASSPVIRYSKTEHQFGKIERGRTVTQSFTIQNTGKRDLTIEKVQSACNCVIHQTSTPAIAPGESATLELKYTPYAATQATEKVAVYSNDLHHPVTTITLRANVVENLASQSILREQKSKVPFAP